MKIVLGVKQNAGLRQFFKESMKFNDLEAKEKILILENYIQESFMQLKPVNIGDGTQEIDHSSSDRSPISDVTEKLMNIEKLANELSSELIKIGSGTRHRLSNIIGYELCSKYEIRGENQYIDIDPKILSELIALSSKYIYEDYKNAYGRKYIKLIDDLLNYWCHHINKELPSINRDSDFVQFLVIVCEFGQEAAYRQYSNYRKSGMNPPLVL
jgi:hypothetical protein